MQKETLTLRNISQDLGEIADRNISNTENGRFVFIVPTIVLALSVGFAAKNLLIGLLIFAIAAYHIFQYAKEYKKYITKKRALNDALDRADISISVEQFSHIALETIYEPHVRGRYGRPQRVDLAKEAKFLYFMSGARWRVPQVDKHYKWSKEYYVSTKGLDNISIPGDEYYYIKLQGPSDIAYVYPCKFFVLDEKLKQNGI